MEYKHHPVKDLGPQLTIEQIDEFEKQLHAPLPKEYREFLLKYNGGYLDEEGETYRTKSDVAWIVRFLGIDCGEENEIDNAFELEYFQSMTPPYCHLFPIGSDWGGNLVCISLDEKDYGKVYGWNHEYGEEEEDWPEALEFCCDSFHQFMLDLEKCED